MRNIVPAILVSILLHAGLFLLAIMAWQNASKPLEVTSVPVTIVSSVPSRQMAEAPVDELAVKTPEPTPAPETPPAPEPPKPEPKKPIPEPAKPEKKVEKAKVPDKAPPDKNGAKKPQPVTKPQPDILKDILENTPSQSKTTKKAQATTRPVNGLSTTFSGPADAGTKVALQALTDRIARLWILSCDVEGFDRIKPKIKFTLSPNGRVIKGPDEMNSGDAVWEAGAARAKSAVNKGQPYNDLPAELYNQEITITFDAHKACHG